MNKEEQAGDTAGGDLALPVRLSHAQTRRLGIRYLERGGSDNAAAFSGLKYWETTVPFAEWCWAAR